MKIIRANPADAAALSAIAPAAKADWGYPPRLREQWREQLTIAPDFIAARAFAALCDGQIVAFHALVATPGAMRLEHLWVSLFAVRPRDRSRTFRPRGRPRRAAQRPLLTIEADPHAEAFYRHLGGVCAGAAPTEIPGRELPVLNLELRRPPR